MWSEPSENAVYNPDGFKTDEELAEYVIKNHLKGAAANEPFMLIMRFFKNQMMRSGSNPIYHNNLIETVYYGRFGVKHPQVSFQKEKKGRGPKPSLFLRGARGDGICFSTASYVEIEDGQSPVFRDGALTLDPGLMEQTKIKGTFRPPGNYYFRLIRSGREEVSAFSFAVGMKAMEKLCLSEAESNREMIAGFIRAAALLKLPFFSGRMRKERIEFGRTHLAELIAKHHELAHAKYQSQEAKNAIASRLAVLREVGFDKDMWEVKVGGIRYQPHLLIPDLIALYPEKPAR